MRRTLLVRLAAPTGALVLTAAAAVGAAAPAAAAPAAAGPATDYTIAFSQAGGLPADVDALVAAAGGTVTQRLPEIGGIGVTSTNPDFAAAMGRNNSVKAVAQSARTALVDPVDAAATGGPSNHGGNAAPAGPDPQPMPDPLGK